MKIGIEEFKWAVVLGREVRALCPREDTARNMKDDYPNAVVVPVNWELEQEQRNRVTVQVPV